MTVTALLGPTNTGKTHRAVERMLEHSTGMIGLPLRLLAREVYDRITAQLGEQAVALVTGEEKRIPPRPRYWVCTVESMPVDREVDFLCVDEIQLCAHDQRGHTFTERLLHARGAKETWLLGSDTMRPIVEELLPAAAVRRHPRFSTLAYVGVKSLASLPPRTAVVAFSAEEVYAIAERLRRRHGGTAVVLGALSPRTRNAQVAMYQAGEVHHMVATDAIGMGLNMDVDRVVFASLDKFDGRQSRPLEVAEMAQIAGRAGRYTADGGFGVLRPLDGLPPRVVGDIESHRFPAVRRLVWRNADLEFSSLEALLASLRARPRRHGLRLVEQADDFDALCTLARSPEIRARARDREAIELLWDVCRVPDFRKLLLESHVQLLAAIYEQLTDARGRIDPDWMGRRIARLDDTEGDIQTLMSRIAFVRTWTYVSNHERWVVDPERWQELTRALEDRLSDALHDRLTERFVDRPAEAWARPAPARRRVRVTGGDDLGSAPESSPFSALAALHARLPARPGEPEPPASGARWVDLIDEAPHAAFSIGDDRSIRWGEERVAKWRRGADALHPEIVLVGCDELGAGARRRVMRRLQAWTRDAIEELLAPLSRIAADAPAPVRGLAYALQQGLGTVDRGALPGKLSSEDRRTLEAAGIAIGQRAIHLPAACKPSVVRLRAALWVAAREPPVMPRVPAAAAVSVPVQADVDPAFYPAIGFVVVAERAIRVDQLERVIARLHALGAGPFALPAELGGWLGLQTRQAKGVVRGLGFREVEGGWQKAPASAAGRRRRSRRREGERDRPRGARSRAGASRSSSSC